MDTTLVAVRRPLVLGDLVPGNTKVRDAALVIASAGIIGALAQVVIVLSFTPVPITGQTFGVLLSGCALGWRRAGLALSLYLGAGFLGLPWFKAHSGGWQGASTGYLFGFLLAAVVCGWYAERGSVRTVFGSIPTMLIGEVCIYAFGVPWLAISTHVGWVTAMAEGFTPFVVVDAIKLALAAGLLPAAWRLCDAKRSD